MKISSRKRIIRAIAVSALFIGALPYVMCRNEHLRIDDWLINARLIWLSEAIKGPAHESCSTWPAWVLYSLPDGIWSFAYSLLITSMWWLHAGVIRSLWLASIPGFCLGFEIAQLFGWLDGQFDISDINLSAIGITIGFFIGSFTISSTSGVGR